MAKLKFGYDKNNYLNSPNNQYCYKPSYVYEYDFDYIMVCTNSSYYFYN